MGQPFTFVLPPPVEVLEDPAAGEASLTWFNDRAMFRTQGVRLSAVTEYGRRTGGDRVILRLSGAPWHRTGVRPFAWDYVELGWPRIRLVVERGVTVTQWSVTFKGGALIGREEEVPIGATWFYPEVVLYRCQDDGLLTAPGLPLEWNSVIGQPYLVGIPPDDSWSGIVIDLGDLKSDLLQTETVQVKPEVSGVSFQHVQGSSKGYATAEVTLSDRGKPAAFCYDARLEDKHQQGQTVSLPVTGGQLSVEFEVKPVQIVIRIVHTCGVKIHVTAHEDNKDAIIVMACQVPLRKVPPQGVELDDADFSFRRHDNDKVIRSNNPPFIITIFELGVSFIPVVGTLYDLGQFAYAAGTGRTFFGYEVKEEELALMGFTSALGLAIPGAAKLRSLRGVRGTKLEAVVADATLAETKRVTDTAFVEAVGSLKSDEVEDLTQGLAKHLDDSVAFPLSKLVSELNDDVAKALDAAVEKQLMEKVFKEDFSGFRDNGLAAAYNRYKLGKKGAALDPAEWAKRQAAARHGKPYKLLRRRMGDDFVDMINRARPKSKVLPSPLTHTDIANYDRLVTRGVEDYGTLRNLSKKLKFGGKFEIDHLLEQRFWRKNPNLASSFDEKGMGMAFVVPKNAAVAREMFKRGGGNKIKYVHTLKTRLLNERIPTGAEAFATVQDIWDAHAFVLHSLEIPSGALKTRFAKDLELMAKELRQSFKSRIPTVKEMEQFPRFVQDATGAWSRNGP